MTHRFPELAQAEIGGRRLFEPPLHSPPSNPSRQGHFIRLIFPVNRRQTKARPDTPIPHIAQTYFSVAAKKKTVKGFTMKSKHARPGLEKRALIVRLRRIKGQIEAIEKMVEADTDCSDVLMQVVSARRALKSFSEEMIQSHLHECIEGAASQSEGRRELRSLLTVLKRYAI
jgi:DNA-binding FrmR family transcriptional regulator